MDDTDLAARLRRLEARVLQLEDRAAILQLIAEYGPAADRSDGEAVQHLFAEAGTYELEGWFFTRDTMVETVGTDLHQRYAAAGSAHVMSLPSVQIDGDRAVALNYAQVFLADGDHWTVDRCSVNRWELVRETGTWKVAQRVNRLLHGSAASHELLAGAAPPPAD